MEAPVLVKPIPSQVVNERAAFGPFELNEYIKAPDDTKLTFRAELQDGEALPKGLICTEDGIITGIPGKDTHGNYVIVITAENTAGSVQAEMVLAIKPSLLTTGTEYMDQLKSQVWAALEQNLPIPNIEEIYSRPITDLEIYYLLERWATLTIWDAFNLELPGEKHALTLEGASEHYHVYDRGSCIIISPKDLFSYTRTLEDGLRTARAAAKEVYNREWTAQLTGFEKFTRAAWVEFQLLNDRFGKNLEVIGYSPSVDDMRLYTTESMVKKFE